MPIFKEYLIIVRLWKKSWGKDHFIGVLLLLFEIRHRLTQIFTDSYFQIICVKSVIIFGKTTEKYIYKKQTHYP